MNWRISAASSSSWARLSAAQIRRVQRSVRSTSGRHATRSPLEVPLTDEAGQSVEFVAGEGGDRRCRQGGQRFVDQAVRPVLRRRRVRRSARTPPGSRRRRRGTGRRRRSGRARSAASVTGRRRRERQREQRGRFAVADVFADGLAGDDLVAERAEQVVAELERLAQRLAVGRQRRARSASSRPANAAPRCSGRSTVYLPDLYAQILRASSTVASARTVPIRSRYWPTLTSRRSSVNTSMASMRRVAQHLVGVDEREVADEDRGAFAEAPRLAAPVGLGVQPLEVTVDRGQAAATVGVVHHVVVNQGERVQQFERGAGVDHRRIVGVAAGTDERPEAEGGPQPFATGQHQFAQRDQWFGQRGVDRRSSGRLRRREARRFGRRRVWRSHQDLAAPPASLQSTRGPVDAYHRRAMA